MHRHGSSRLFEGRILPWRAVVILLWVLFCIQAYTMGEAPHANASAVEDDTFARASLQGLSGVYLSVGELGLDVGKKELTTAIIQEDADLRLRAAGIPVLTHEQWTNTKGGPVCYIEVDIVRDIVMTDVLKSDLYAYVVTVEFNQDVVLLRNPAVQTLSPTWSSSYLGVTNSLPRIREKIKEMVDRFVEAYTVVNPGTPFAQEKSRKIPWHERKIDSRKPIQVPVKAPVESNDVPGKGSHETPGKSTVLPQAGEK